MRSDDTFEVTCRHVWKSGGGGELYVGAKNHVYVGTISHKVIISWSFLCLVFLIDLLTYPYEKNFPKMLVFQIITSCPLSLPSRSSQCPCLEIHTKSFCIVLLVCKIDLPKLCKPHKEMYDKLHLSTFESKGEFGPVFWLHVPTHTACMHLTCTVQGCCPWGCQGCHMPRFWQIG